MNIGDDFNKNIHFSHAVDLKNPLHLNEYKKNNIIERMNSDELVDKDLVSYDLIKYAVKFLLCHTKYRPKIGIVCGSGLSSLAESIKDPEIVPYELIPNFPTSTVAGHSGQMVFGTINDVPVMCMQGRFHYYEGYSLSQCCMSIRIMKLIGVTNLILTNAAGSLNESYNVGDIMILKDHINFLGLSGNSPLRGSNELHFGPRFPPTNRAYDANLRSYALDIGRELNIENEVHEGIYVCVGGPNYETCAEIRMMKAIGGDCIGMSTVHEVITAKHCDMKVMTLSLISNKCIADVDSLDEPNHEEVVEAANKKQPILKEFVSRLVFRISQSCHQISKKLHENENK